MATSTEQILRISCYLSAPIVGARERIGGKSSVNIQLMKVNH